MLLRINTIERADLEYFNSHVSDVVNLISESNLYSINKLFTDNKLQSVGINQTTEIPEIVDDNLPF